MTDIVCNLDYIKRQCSAARLVDVMNTDCHCIAVSWLCKEYKPRIYVVWTCYTHQASQRRMARIRTHIIARLEEEDSTPWLLTNLDESFVHAPEAGKTLHFVQHNFALSFRRQCVLGGVQQRGGNLYSLAEIQSWCPHDTAMGISTSESPASGHFETGSLTQRAPQQSEFIGSSSGVHFIRRVREGFAGTTVLDGRSEYRVPRAEDTVGGDDEEDNNCTNSSAGQQRLRAQRLIS